MDVFYMCASAQIVRFNLVKLRLPGRSSLNQEATMSINPNTRVLYVDGHEDSREMLSTLLGVSRIEAKAVATAGDALSLIREERFHMYLLEAWLPDLDGFELCCQLRASDPHTPILFFSSAGYEADKKRGFEAGANAYVIKPDIDGLLGSINRFVSSAKSALA
jgi:DNA-binding response OmpR family regulator